MNVFGDSRNVGVPGRPGKDAFNIIKWAPHATRRLFRESESIYIYFDSLTDGLIFDKEKKKPVGLKNHGLSNNAVFFGKVFPEIRRIEGGNYALNLQNSIFGIKPVRTGTVSPSIVIFALSFKPLSESETPRILFSNEKGSRMVLNYNKKIGTRQASIICIQNGTASKEIFIVNGDWTCLLIQYMVEDGKSFCHYYVNYEHGIVESAAQPGDDHILYIGGHPTRGNPAHHALGSFEMYHRVGDTEQLSEEFQKCLIKDLLERIGAI